MEQSYVIERRRAYTAAAANVVNSKASLTGWASFALLILLAALSIHQQKAPAAVAADAPPAEFSSARAMKHLAVIAEKPHAIGSPEHEAVRDYIVGELSAMGLAPQIQEATSVNARWGAPYRAGTVRNVVARLSGTANSRAVMLASHYDSAPTSPGASDDGAGVVAMLETLRALKAGAPLKNDVVLLFTDGEETGLLGAQAFVDGHAWAQEVGLVLNFEARGNGGPSVMFETSEQNGWLIKEFSRAAPHPIANSLAYEIYRLLPNDTDLTVFKSAGLAGMNFAYIDGLASYHTSLDTLANIDERSLQHQGSYALALTRHFGGLDITGRKESNDTYFNVLGATLIRYGSLANILLAVLTISLFVVALIIARGRGQLRTSGFALGVLASLLSIVAAVGVVALAWRFLRASLLARGRLLPGDNAYDAGLYALGFVALATAVTAALHIWFRRKVNVSELTLGAAFWWAVAMVLAAVLLPGGSYLLMWPLLFSLVGFIVAARYSEAAPVRLGVVLFLSAAPAVILFAPAIQSFFAALALSQPALIMIPVALLLGLLAPHFARMTSGAKWLLPGGAAALGLSLILFSLVTGGFDSERPRPNSVFYALNADSGKAIWGSTDAQTDSWTAQFFPAGGERGGITEYMPARFNGFMRSAAPAASLPGPELVVLEDKTDGDTRSVRLGITSTRRAPSLTFYVDEETEVLDASVNGKELRSGSRAQGVTNERWSFIYSAVPAEGIILDLRVRAERPLKMIVTDRSNGLPQSPGILFRPRPADMMPMPSNYSDATFVSKTFSL